MDFEDLDDNVWGGSSNSTTPAVLKEEADAWTTPKAAQTEFAPLDDFDTPAFETPAALSPPAAQLVEPVAEEEEEDDFDDFGDFDEAQDDAFGAFEEPAYDPTPQPVATTSRTRPLDLTDKSIDSITSQLHSILSTIHPDARSAVSDLDLVEISSPEGLLKGSETAEALWKQLQKPPDLPPVNWKRSEVRKRYLVALGVPVNLDELVEKPSKQALQPALTLTTSSPTPQRTSSPGPASAPASISSNALHGASISRSSSPSLPPVLDRRKAKGLLELSAEDLEAESAERLEEIQRELEEFVRNASEVLTYNVEKRERLRQDGDTYDQMIQDLVSTAQKLRPSTNSTLARKGSLPRSGNRIFGARGSPRPASPMGNGSPKIRQNGLPP